MKNIRREITNEIGTYKLALVTEKFVYYVNEHESDENGCVLMYDKNDKLVSDNYMGYSSYMDDMEEIVNNNIQYEFVDEELLEYAREYFEEE